MQNKAILTTPQKNLSEAYLRQMFPLWKEYITTDLRRRFDDANFQDAINILDQCRDLGFIAKFEEMKKDFCSESENKIIWDMHERARAKEMAEGDDDPYEMQIESILHETGREL